MATRSITTKISLDGEKEFKRQMADVNSELKTLRSEMQLSEAQFKGQANSMEALTDKERILRKEIEQQEEKVRALSQAVADASEAYGDADRRTDGFRQSLNRAQAELIEMNRELDDTERYLEEAARSADGTADSIDGFGKKAGESGGGLGGFVGNLSTLKSALTGSAIVGGLAAVKEAVFSIVDGTAEYRQIMGTLEVSSQAAGYSAEQTSEVYMRLYSVLGDTQAAATATANLQAIGLSQEDLMRMTDLAIGAWATYGDSIPIDSMAEAINLGAQQSEISSGLADALEWAGVNQDEFKAKLEGANSATERANIIMEELAKHGLADTADGWFAVNEDIVKANEAQAKWDETMGKLGKTLSPVKDALLTFGADALEPVIALIQAAIKGVSDLIDWFNKIPDDPGIDARGEGRGTGSLNGSHAGGLRYVPFDGYVAELHRGKMVLPREESDVVRALQSGAPGARGVTTQDLQAVTAAAVNAIGQTAGAQPPIQVRAIWEVNGREFYADTIEDLRAVEKANPEVTSDK